MGLSGEDECMKGCEPICNQLIMREIYANMANPDASDSDGDEPTPAPRLPKQVPATRPRGGTIIGTGTSSPMRKRQDTLSEAPKRIPSALNLYVAWKQKAQKQQRVTLKSGR